MSKGVVYTPLLSLSLSHTHTPTPKAALIRKAELQIKVKFITAETKRHIPPATLFYLLISMQTPLKQALALRSLFLQETPLI